MIEYQQFFRWRCLSTPLRRRYRSRSGRPRLTTLTQRQDRHIIRQHLHDWFATATQTARQTIGIHRRPVSDDTVRCRLADHNLKCRRPVKGPVLTQRHRDERLRWATTRRNSTLIKAYIAHQLLMEKKSPAQTRRTQFRWLYGLLGRTKHHIGLFIKLEPAVFQKIGPGRGNGVTAAGWINQILQPHIMPHFA